MREIVFRGKCLDDGEWIEGNIIINRNYCNNSIESCQIYSMDIVDANGSYAGYDFVEVDPDTVGQYTGLTDKNGNKIFEGDIVKFKHDAMGEWIGDVFWDENDRGWNAHLKFLGKGEPLFGGECIGLGYLSELYEVIGNIYDNPELPEGENDDN